MIAAITSILGALSAFVPSLVQFFTLRETNKQQLQIKQLEMQAAKEGTALQIDLANSQADVQQQQRIYSFAGAPTGVKWIDGLAALMRPYITVIMFHMWLAKEITLLWYGLHHEFDLVKLAALVWTPDTEAVFGAIMGFWFGNRMLLRGNQQMAATLAVTAPAGKGVSAPVRSAPTSGAPVMAHDGTIPAPAGDRSQASG